MFGRYVDPQSTGELLFDLGEYEHDVVSGNHVKPERVQVQTYNKGRFEEREGYTSRSYQNDLKVKVGLEGEYGFFSGEVETEFEESHRRCTSFHFLSKVSRAYRYLLRLDSDPREFLTERARADLADMEPEDLFGRYGTHYLNSLIIGGCAVFSSATNTASSARSTSFSQTAELAFKSGLGSISLEEGSEQRKQVETFVRNSKINVTTRGGRPEYGEQIAKGEYEKWLDSIEGNMDWVALPVVERGSDLRALVPIWELCDDPDRRKEIEAAFHEYAKEFEPEPEPTVAPVYGHFANNPRRWYYSLDAERKGWNGQSKPFFYVSTEPGEGRVPVYRHSAPSPIRYELSVKPDPNGDDEWTRDGTDPVWYAYPPDAGEADGRVAIYGHKAPTRAAESGLFYNVRGSPAGGNRRRNRPSTRTW